MRPGGKHTHVTVQSTSVSVWSTGTSRQARRLKEVYEGFRDCDARMKQSGRQRWGSGFTHVTTFVTLRNDLRVSNVTGR